MSESNNPQSRVEELIENILGAGYQVEPQSRVEKILHAIATQGTYTDPPQSRVEKLLIDVLHSGGGGGVTVEALAVDANGTYTAPSGKAYSPVTVNVSGGGGQEVPEKDVNFIDYDGTVLYSYTAQEALALTALPANPSHEGLTAQGWNYTLAEVKTEVNSVGGATVGQMYVTDDGKTRLYCRFEKGRLTPYLGLAVNGTIEVDWGDGSTTDTITGTSESSVISTQHTYASAGDYVITIAVVSGTFAISGTSSGSYILSTGTAQDQFSIIYLSAIKRIEVGNDVVLKEGAFERCYLMKTITIPSSLNVPARAFERCYSLESIVFPDNLQTISSYVASNALSIRNVSIPPSVETISPSAFYLCRMLAWVNIPSSVTTIEDTVFSSCSSLLRIVFPPSITQIKQKTLYSCEVVMYVSLPSSVASINQQAFYSCVGMTEYHIKATTPPTLNINAFNSNPPDVKIYVPTASLETYKTATNWSNYANKMVGE